MKSNKWTSLVAVLILSCLTVQGQKIGTWKSYLAYHNATQLAETPHSIFAVCDGAMFSYSFEDQSVQSYSSREGLNDMEIRFINYCPEAKALLIVYDNSNIDIFLGKNNVYNLSFIKDKFGISNKIVNDVEIRGGYAYLATGFGVVAIDMKKRVVENTYGLDANTTTTCEWNNYRYAATNEGLLRAPLSSNLSDKTKWEKVILMGIQGANIVKMIVFKDHLILYDDKQYKIWSLSIEGTENQIFTDNLCRQLSVWNDQLVLVFWSGMMFYDDVDAPVKWLSLDDQVRSVSSRYSEGDYWVAWGTRGVRKIAVKAEEYTTLLSDIKINSPIRNLSILFTFAQNKLLVTGGDRGPTPKGLPGTFMIYENKQWMNLDDQALAQKTGLPCTDLIAAVVDPRDPHHYFVSSWRQGLYEFQDTTLINRYTNANSSLISATTGVLVDGLAYDRNNNLYVVNSRISRENIHILSPDGKWHAHKYDELSGGQGDKLIITRDNKKWVNSFRLNVGIFVLDDKGTITDSSDDVVYFSQNFVDQQGRSVSPTTYSCIAEDLNGTVWVGSDVGPITFSSAEQVGRGECYRPVIVDEYGAGHYLMEDEKVTAIAVDGGNRKWIGTASSGVFLVDQSEGLTLQNFTTYNSEILSDCVSALAINDQTGEVFIGTDRGICSYQGDAVAGKPDYSEVRAFPNPVHPLRNNQVVITGLMQNSRVKITDLTGNLIKEATSNGGQYTWNCAGPAGEIVKAGIYLVFATLPDGSQGVVTKIMVIK